MQPRSYRSSKTIEFHPTKEISKWLIIEEKGIVTRGIGVKIVQTGPHPVTTHKHQDQTVGNSVTNASQKKNLTPAGNSLAEQFPAGPLGVLYHR